MKKCGGFILKKKRISGICLVLVLALGMCIGAAAAGNLETISAYLNRGITIKLDGQTQTMCDAQGNRVYPISYNGTTYVPIRAVSNMLGIGVEWDGANNTVLLGETGTAKDFIEDIEPYAQEGLKRYTSADTTSKTIAGKEYSTFMTWVGSSLSHQSYYNLAGKYDTLTFQAYNEIMDKDYVLFFYGDNDTLLERVTVTGGDLPKTYTVDVSNVQQLMIKGHESAYIFNATIE